MFGDTPRKVGEFVLKYRWLIIIFNTILFFAVMGAMMQRGMRFGEHVEYMATLRENPLAADTNHVAEPPIFNSDYRVWFEEDNPELMAYDRLQQVFSKEDNLIIAIISKSGEVFTNENLESIQFLTDNGWTVPYVNRVDGLTNFNYTYVDEDDLLVEDFVVDLPLSEEELAAKKELALSDPLLPNFLVTPSSEMTQIQLRVIVPVDFPNGYLDTRSRVEELVAMITQETLIDENGVEVPNEQYNPDLEIRLSGTVMLSTSFQVFAEKDASTLTPLMLLLIMVVLALSIRAFWGTLTPMVLLLTSVLFPIALFVGFFGLSLTNVSLNVVQMLVAVAIADSVHVLAIFYRGLRNGLDKRAAIMFTIEKNFLPCGITSITTAIGFYSLMLQDMPPFVDLGLYAGTGCLYAFFASVYTLPAFLSLLPFKQREAPKDAIKTYESKGYEGLSAFVVNNQKAIRWATLITTVVAIIFVAQVNIDSTAIKYFDEDSEFRKASEYIDQNLIGTNPIEFQFDSGEDNGIYDPAYLKKIEQFQEKIGAHPEYDITYVSGITDIIKRINKTMHGDDPAYYRIPEANEVTAEGDTIDAKRLIAQYLLLYQMSLPQGMELTNQIDIRNRTTRVTAYVRSISSYDLLDHAANIHTWIKEAMPDVNALPIGVPIMFGKLISFAIPGILKSLIVSLVAITIVLTITFRSFKVGLFSMIPNVWPLAFVFGMIGMLGIEVNLSVAVVGMITLGIAVDDTVHYLTKYTRGRAEGLDPRGAIQYAYRQVAAPLIYTSIILVAGFGSLMQSDFAINADMGLYCTMVIALALFADFVLLPAVILKFDKTLSQEVSS